MFQYQCLNPISKVGLDGFTNDYTKTEEIEKADAILVRSASMHEMKLPENIQAIARAGAGVNNIPLQDCAEQGIVVFNTPGANANGVKEMVIAGMLLASRDIVGGVEWVKQEKDNENVGKLAEKQKKQFAGCEIKGKKLGVIGLGAIGAMVANTAIYLGMEYEIDSMDLLSQKGYCLHWPAGGVCNTGDTFLTELSDVSGDVVDMEAYAQALVCRAKNVPFISVKYVTDIIGQNSVKHWEDKLADARKGLGEFFEKLGGV